MCHFDIALAPEKMFCLEPECWHQRPNGVHTIGRLSEACDEGVGGFSTLELLPNVPTLTHLEQLDYPGCVHCINPKLQFFRR